VITAHPGRLLGGQFHRYIEKFRRLTRSGWSQKPLIVRSSVYWEDNFRHFGLPENMILVFVQTRVSEEQNCTISARRLSIFMASILKPRCFALRRAKGLQGYESAWRCIAVQGEQLWTCIICPTQPGVVLAVTCTVGRRKFEKKIGFVRLVWVWVHVQCSSGQ